MWSISEEDPEVACRVLESDEIFRRILTTHGMSIGYKQIYGSLPGDLSND